MRTIAPRFIIAASLLSVISCSSSDSSSSKTPDLQPTFVCSTNSDSNLTQSGCPTFKETTLPSSFFSESSKIIKFNDGFLVLRNIAEPGFVMKSFSILEDTLGSERGTLSFVRDNQVVWELKKQDLNIYDFDIHPDKSIIAIARDSSTDQDLARVLFIDGQGIIKNTSTIDDESQDSDHCIAQDNDVFFPDALCLEKEYNKIYPHLAFPGNLKYIYRMAKIAWSKTKSQAYLVIDRGQREVSTIYKLKISNSFETTVLWKQLLVYGTRAASPEIFLNNGTERYAMNRFARFTEKSIAIDDQDNILVALNADMNKKVPLVAPLTETENSDISSKNQWNTHIFKYSKQGTLAWKQHIPFNTDSAPSTALTLNNGSAFLTSHNINNDKLYRISILKISTANGAIVKTSEPLSLLPENSFALSIAAISENEVVFSGLTGFRQNPPPKGFSLFDNGKSFVAKYNFSTKSLQSLQVRKSQRKDMITNILVDDSSLFLLFDMNGPTTHSADVDPLQAYQGSSILEVDLQSAFK